MPGRVSFQLSVWLMYYCILHQWDFQVSTGVFSYIIHPLVDLAKLTGSYLPVLCAFHNVEARCKIVAFSSSETCSLVTYMEPSVQLVLPDKSLLLLAAHISSWVTAVRSAGRVGDCAFAVAGPVWPTRCKKALHAACCWESAVMSLKTWSDYRQASPLFPAVVNKFFFCTNIASAAASKMNGSSSTSNILCCAYIF